MPPWASPFLLSSHKKFLCTEHTPQIQYLYELYTYLPTPSLGHVMTQGHFFKRSLTGLNSEFSFSETSCLTKAEEPSLPYYLPIAGGRTIGFIPFPKVQAQCEMQSVTITPWAPP